MKVGIIVALLATLAGGPMLADGPVYLGSYVWRSDLRDFGEFSGLHMTDSRRFVTVTDRGQIGHGVLERNASGQISGVRLDGFTPLRDSRGEALRGHQADAESVVMAPDGRLFVAFERNHRVLSYTAPGGPATPLPAHPDFVRLRDNLGIEAMAMAPDGTLYATPELPPRGWASGAGHPVYRYRNGTWDNELSITRDSLFLPVGAAFGPDGRLYLLERNFVPALGFRSRIRRFDVGETALTGGEILLDTPRGRHDNLEGLAIWRDGSGALIATMISDDNQNRATPTEWVEYRLPR